MGKTLGRPKYMEKSLTFCFSQNRMILSAPTPFQDDNFFDRQSCRILLSDDI